MKKAAKGVTKSIETITDTATTCGNAIASMFSDLGQDDLANGLGTAMELFGQLGNAAAGRREGDLGRPGIDGIFQQFFGHTGRSFYNFTGRDQFGGMLVQHTNFRHGSHLPLFFI